MPRRFPMTSAILPVLLCLGFLQGAAAGQVVDNPGFKALPRPINYAMPLAPRKAGDGLTAARRSSSTARTRPGRGRRPRPCRRPSRTGRA